MNNTNFWNSDETTVATDCSPAIVVPITDTETRILSAIASFNEPATEKAVLQRSHIRKQVFVKSFRALITTNRIQQKGKGVRADPKLYWV